MNTRLEVGGDSVLVTESRPTQVLEALHSSADPHREYLFANRDATSGDLVLVAWMDKVAVGYIAVSDERHNGLQVWEHVVVPALRERRIGQRLLREAARRALPGSRIVIDPLGELDGERVNDYYARFGFRVDASDGLASATTTAVLRATQPFREGDERAIRVSSLLESKAPGVITIAPDATLRDAVSMLHAGRIGAVVLSSDGSRVEGICSERDVVVAMDRHGPDALEKPVGQVTTTDVVTCTADDTVSFAMEIMTRNRLRHLPVTSAGRLVGIISLGDIVFDRLAQVAPAGASAT